MSEGEESLCDLKNSASASSQLFRRYGLTDPDVADLKAKQGYCCAICDRPFKQTPQVDHDHKTGKVRGLLCIRCNTVLGMAQDKTRILRTAIKYLKNHRG